MDVRIVPMVQYGTMIPECTIVPYGTRGIFYYIQYFIFYSINDAILAKPEI